MLISENQISEALKDLPGWTILNGKLHKTFTFPDFSTLFEFMYQVADSSQKLNHHPNMTSTWNTLTLDYDTWSLGHVISNLDLKAAGAVEKLYDEGNYADTDN
jgi:4a-hydroxytetrahydrobiopterin dehydratase